MAGGSCRAAKRAPPSSPSSAPPTPPLARDVPRWGAAVCLERPGPPLCLHDGPKAATPPATPGPAVLNPGSHSRRGGVSFFAASTWEIARHCFLRCPCSVFPLCSPFPLPGCLSVGRRRFNEAFGNAPWQPRPRLRLSEQNGPGVSVNAAPRGERVSSRAADARGRGGRSLRTAR